MSDFLNRMKAAAKADLKTIVLPEGEDPRTIEAAKKIVEEGLANGLVMNRIGSSILRFLPPLVITREEVDEACDRLEKILDRLA